MNTLNIVVSCIAILVWTYIFLYTVKLEQIGCRCSEDWRRTYIKYYSLLLIVLLLLSILNFQSIPPQFMSFILAILGIMFIIVVFQYIHRLKREKCECSKSEARTILEILNYIQIGIGIFVILILILAIAGIIIIGKTKIMSDPIKKPVSSKTISKK